MAIIGDIRKKSGLLIAIVGIALAAFVLGDLLTKGPKRQKFNIGVIEGEDIPAIGFNQRVEDNLGYQRQNLGRENLTAEEQFNTRQSTWNEMVNEILMDKQYKALGMSVSTEELDELIRGANPHSYIQQSFTDPQTGVFNPELVNNFLVNLDKVEPAMRQRYLYIEKAVKNDRLNTKYNALITKAYYIPSVIAKADFASKTTQFEMLVVAKRFNALPDDEVTVTDKDLKNYYEENKFRFKQSEELRSIDYVVFNIEPSDDDRQKVVKEVYEINEEFKTAANPGLFVSSVSDKRYDSTWFRIGVLPLNIEEGLFGKPIGTTVGPFQEGNTFTMARLVDVQSRPDSLRASHILVSYQGARAKQDLTRSKEAAKKMADSIYTVVTRDRRQFAMLATAMSDDASAAMRAGDLGWFADGAMVYPFNEAVLKGKVGDIVQVETQFGYHIIDITGKKDLKPRYRVAKIERTIEPSTKTIQETYVKASQFSANNRNSTSFEKAVADMSLAKRSADDLTALSNNIPGIDTPREIVRWAFMEKTKKGDVSAAFELEGKFVVAVLKDIKPKGYQLFDIVKPNIEPLVRNQLKAKKLMTQMDDAMKASGDLSVIASALNSRVDTLTMVSFASGNLPLFGREPEVVGKASAMNPGDLSQPIIGQQAVYIIKIADKTNPVATDDDVRNNRMSTSSFFRSRAMRELFSNLEKNAKIEDHRMLYY